MLLKKTIADITRQSEQRNKKQTIELRQEQNKLLIEENQSKTTFTEMHVESQKKLRNDQNLSEKFEVIKERKYRKSRSIEKEAIKCQNRHETFLFRWQ